MQNSSARAQYRREKEVKTCIIRVTADQFLVLRGHAEVALDYHVQSQPNQIWPAAPTTRLHIYAQTNSIDSASYSTSVLVSPVPDSRHV